MKTLIKEGQECLCQRLWATGSFAPPESRIRFQSLHMLTYAKPAKETCSDGYDGISYCDIGLSFLCSPFVVCTTLVWRNFTLKYIDWKYWKYSWRPICASIFNFSYIIYLKNYIFIQWRWQWQISFYFTHMLRLKLSAHLFFTIF